MGNSHNLLPVSIHRAPPDYRHSLRSRCLFITFVGILSFLSLSRVNLALYWPTNTTVPVEDSLSSPLAQFQNCSIEDFLGTGLPFLKDVKPIPLEEFVERRNRLAVALDADGVDAFVVEPGYTFQYYANISQPDWEVWEPEERPFLMVIQPIKTSTGSITANTTFLVAAFEDPRARLLNMPFTDPLQTITWLESWNPYATLLKSWPSSPSPSTAPKIMVDDEMRDFIVRGLSTNGFNVQGLNGSVEKVKQTKSPHEIEILRAVNTGTVEALRSTRKCLYPGISESEIALVLDNTLRAGGLDPFFDIVLFDENAYNGHGGTDGSKRLEQETIILIDVGAHLYGYSSDICRTFFAPFLPQPSTEEEVEALSPSVREKMRVWDVTLAAQTESMRMLVAGNTAASVDDAVRELIVREGYGEGFELMRVGHGIGTKAHESPYLHGGDKSVLVEGMTFTSEPGIYLLDRFGVRHEDVLLVRGSGEPEVLSGERARDAWNP